MDDYFNNQNNANAAGGNDDTNKNVGFTPITPVDSQPTEPVAPSQPASAPDEPQVVHAEPIGVAPQQNQYNAPSQDNGYFVGQYDSAVNQPQYSVYADAPSDGKNGKKKKDKKKGNGGKKAVAIILIIAIVAAVLFGYLFFSGKSINSIIGGSSSSESATQGTNAGEASAKVADSEKTAEKSSDGTLTVAGVVKKTIDSCVGISVYTNQNSFDYFNGYGSSNSGSTESGEGSGVIMSESNGKTYIMTCAHVIADGSTFKVTTNDDKKYDATMVGYDSQTDIGVLSINATGLQAATFAKSESVTVGEQVVAIGCPGGLEFKNSVTTGIVSALEVPVSSSIGYNNQCIQTDTAINPGNSGGALFNMQGQIIGINSSKIASTDYEGMGFAVPSDTAISTAESLIANGYVAGRAKLGIEYVALENYNNASSIMSALESKGFKDAKGTIVIQSVSSESDLKNSDVKQYDMIVAVNGTTMTSVDVLTSTLSKSKPGDTIKLTIARAENNQIKTFDVNCKLIESKN